MTAGSLRHPLTSVIALATAAVLAGARSLTAIAEWTMDDPAGPGRARGGPPYASANCTGEIDRKDFDITTNIPMDGGGVVIGDTINCSSRWRRSCSNRPRHDGSALSVGRMVHTVSSGDQSGPDPIERPGPGEDAKVE